MRLFHSSWLKLAASKARSVPVTTAWLALAVVGWLPQIMPVPDIEPLADTDSIAPGSPFGTVIVLVITAEVVNSPVPVLYLYAFRRSCALQMYIRGMVGLFQ